MTTFEHYMAEIRRLKAILSPENHVLVNEHQRTVAAKKLMAIRDQMLKLLETARD